MLGGLSARRRRRRRCGRPSSRARPRWSCATRARRVRGCERSAASRAPSGPAREGRRRSGPPASGSAAKIAAAARRAWRCRASARARAPAPRASLRTPKSSASGGLPGARLRSPRRESSSARRGSGAASIPTTAAARSARPRDDDDDAPVPCCRERASFASPRPSVATNGVAIFPKAMPNYRELLQQVKAEIDEVDVARGARAARRARRAARRRRARAATSGRGPHPGRDPHPARQPRVAHRAGRARSRPADRPLLRRRQPLGLRREDARGARLRERRLARRRLHRLEAQRLPDRAAAHARRREARALQPARPDPRGRRGGAAQAARLARPAARRGRARLARRRSTSRRPASDGSASSTTTCVDASNLQRQIAALDRSGSASWKVGVGEAHARGAQPRRRGRAVPASGSPPRTSSGSSPTAGT